MPGFARTSAATTPTGLETMAIDQFIEWVCLGSIAILVLVLAEPAYALLR
jgi:hypothetical protein